MFEDKYDRSSWDEQYAYGRQEGYGIGYAESCLRYLIHCIRDKEETEEERKEKLWAFFETKFRDVCREAGGQVLPCLRSFSNQSSAE